MIFAQTQVVESGLSSLMKEGVLGIMLAIALVLVFILGKLLLTEKDKRIEDAGKYQTDLVKPIADMGKTLERIEEKTLVAKGRR
jgi:hypothetical protein